MSYEEHLMENALTAQQDELQGENRAKEYFMTDDINKEMADSVGISLDMVWRLAVYVTYVWNEGRIMDDLDDDEKPCSF